MSCGAETEANTVMTSLLTGVTFEIPDVDLDGAEYSIPADTLPALPAQLTNALLTSKNTPADGTGTFDIIMSAINSHLKAEYDAGRITGAEYAKVHLGALEAGLANAVQFLLQKDTSYWTAIRARFDARRAEIEMVKSRVELVTAKVNLAAIQYQARTQEATYALTKMKLATESMAYCTGKYNLESILPQNLAMLTKQVAGQEITNNIGSYNLANILPIQKKSAEEQMEAARAQTMNTRSDGVTTIVGVLGKQKDLYTQQITSYQRDSELKATKIWTDAWITMKTIDEGLLPPTQFSNANIDAILTDIKTNNNIG